MNKNPIEEWTQNSEIRNWFERIEVVFADEEYTDSIPPERDV